MTGIFGAQPKIPPINTTTPESIRLECFIKYAPQKLVTRNEYGINHLEVAPIWMRQSFPLHEISHVIITGFLADNPAAILPGQGKEILIWRQRNEIEI